MADQHNENPTTPQTPAAPAATPPAAEPSEGQVEHASEPLMTGRFGAVSTGEVTLGDEPRTVRQADPPKQGFWWGTGRRKSAVARVRIKPGQGEIKVQISGNKYKTVEDYFSEERDRDDAVAPLKATGTQGKMDVIARLDGGGFMGQAQAMRLGISRALVSYDPNTLEALRDAGFLTRDPREVERKKYGQVGARRKFQFSKR